MEDCEQGLEPMVPMEVETICPVCGEKGVTRLLLVPDEFFQGTVLTTFLCPGCHAKDRQTIEMDVAGEKGIKIEALLDRPEDLRRYIILAKGAEVEIESGEKGVSYTNEEDKVTTVEGLVRTLLEKIVGTGTVPEDRLLEEELEGLAEYKETAVFLQNSLEEISMTVRITDPRGLSRLFPAGETPKGGARDLPFSHFEDEQTKMWECDNPKDAEDASQ